MRNLSQCLKANPRLETVEEKKVLRTELLEIIANGESSGVEFKRDDIHPESLAEEVVAMANFRGGIVLLGVEDDGTISGIQRANVEEWAMNCISGKIHPMILPFYEEVQMGDMRVAILYVEQGIDKPYVRRHKGAEEIFIRMGTSSRSATREQQARLHALGGMLHPEVLPVAGTSLSSLSKERLHDYLKNILNDPDVPTDDASWIERLMGLGYMTKGVSDNPLCTIAGILVFGVSPRRYLGQAGVRLIVFDGINKEYRALLDVVLDGPMVALWRIDRGQRLLSENDYGLIERLVEKMTPFVSHEAADIDEHFRRERQWHYPREAIREAVINALVHRDWTRSVDIEINVYSDRLEIISPGAMQNSMTIEKMLAGQRSPRNSLLVEVLRDYGYVDARGMGVRTKIVPLMRSHSGKEPFFEATEDYLKTVLYR
jgi:ATP-dependent DNA helicase RecG